MASGKRGAPLQGYGQVSRLVQGVAGGVSLLDAASASIKVGPKFER